MNRKEMAAQAKKIAQEAEAEAVKGLEAAEAQWPIGTVLIVAVCSFMLGLWVRGLF